MQPRSYNRLRHRLALLLAATCIALVLGEALVRGLRAAPKLKSLDIGSEDCVYQRADNPVLGFELKPNYRCDTPDYIATYERTNAHGLRDDERAIEKPTGTKRVLLLGDSVVEGYGLAQQATVPNQLQQMMRTKNWEVFNFGVSAYCTRAEIELLETKGLQFQPDVVVLVFVENDFDNFNREAFPLGESIQRPAVAEWCFKRSHLFRLASLELNLFQFRQSDPVTWNREAIGEDNVAVGLKRFRELADQYKFQPLVAIWPRFEDDLVVDVQSMPDSDQLVVEALAAANGLPTFRLSAYFQTELRSGVGSKSPRLRFSQGDKLHPSVEGARVAALAIREMLTNNKLEVQTTTVDSLALDAAISEIPRQSPNYARVHNRIGNRLLKEGQLDAAIHQYELALREDPENSASHNNLGIAIQRQGGPENHHKAVEHYRRAIKLQPDFAEAQLNLGNAIEASDPAAAQKCFIQAVQLQPRLAAAHFGLSRSLYRINRLTAAAAGLEQVLKLDPSHEDAMLLLATTRTKQQRYPEAKSTYERLLEFQPADAEALNNLAAICIAMGDETTAIEHLRAAVASDPSHPSAAKNLEKLLAKERP